MSHFINYNYFEYKGKQYPIGTAIMLTDKYASTAMNRYNQDTIIWKHYSSNDRHFYNIFNGYNAWGEIINCPLWASPDVFIKEIVENPTITMDVVTNPKYRKQDKDSENDDVKFGWFLYIVIMFGLVIFKDAWIGWIAATIYFFTWRKKKLIK